MAGFMRLEVWKTSEGWFGRYTAPGYMDCTEDNGPFKSPEEAALETFALYGDSEDPDGPTPDEIECAYLVNEIFDSKASPA